MITSIGMTPAQVVVLLVIAALGHVMALLWYLAVARDWRISERTIYDMPIPADQIRRELKNSLHAPIHSVLLAPLLYFGFFANTSWLSFVYTALLAMVWAEVWHYGSHRAFHLPALHWIHAEHHKSHLNTWLTAISFSFSEKLIFDAGFLSLFAAADPLLHLNFFGIAAWYIGYLVINSFSHANFELKSREYVHGVGKVITSTTYHSLHHSRYTGNYGLGTRLLDRMFKTEWEDYERLYDQVSRDNRPLRKLSEKVAR